MAESYRIAYRMKAACERVTGFRFEKPEGFSFTAGQYLRLTLPTAEGDQTKSFSIASAPRDPFVEIATRMTGSAFKNALETLARGDEVDIQGPYGHLVLAAEMDRVCFLVGGVGITPARSIIRDSEQRRTGLRTRLFYGNHDQACIPYSGEFAEYERKDRRFACVHVLEDPLPGWNGERGFITAELVRRYIDPSDGWHFFVAGPPVMGDAMRKVLDELSVPEPFISAEDFTGYATPERA